MFRHVIGCAHCSNTANTRATPLWLQLREAANWNSSNSLTETQINQVRLFAIEFICFYFCWFSLLSHSSFFAMENYLRFFVNCFGFVGLFFANVWKKFRYRTLTLSHRFISYGTWTIFIARIFTPKTNWTYFLLSCIRGLQLRTDRERCQWPINHQFPHVHKLYNHATTRTWYSHLLSTTKYRLDRQNQNNAKFRLRLTIHKTTTLELLSISFYSHEIFCIVVGGGGGGGIQMSNNHIAIRLASVVLIFFFVLVIVRSINKQIFKPKPREGTTLWKLSHSRTYTLTH